MPKAKSAKKKKKSPKRSSSRTKPTRRKKPIRQKKTLSGKRGKRPAGRTRKQSKLTQVAVAIGSVLGKADSAAHKAVSTVKGEAVAISEQVKDALG
jgi:hypothetical protein